MSLKHFIQDALSSWMKQKGPESDIVLSSRMRLARNFEHIQFLRGIPMKKPHPSYSNLKISFQSKKFPESANLF